MSPEEKNVIGGIFERLKGAASAQRDVEAEKFIADQIKAQPYAPYVMAQSIYAQEQALTGMQQQIEQLQGQVQQLQHYAQQLQQQPQGGGGFLGGLFGGGARQAPLPPQGMMNRPMQHGQMGGQPPAGPWGQQPGGMGQGGMGQGGMAPPSGPWGQQAQQQRGGGMGFLGTAAMTAAGVAGGMLAANAISNMMSGNKAGDAQAAAPAAPASQQPASYEVPSHGGHAQDASYDDGSNYDSGGGDDWA